MRKRCPAWGGTWSLSFLPSSPPGQGPDWESEESSVDFDQGFQTSFLPAQDVSRSFPHVPGLRSETRYLNQPMTLMNPYAHMTCKTWLRAGSRGSTHTHTHTLTLRGGAGGPCKGRHAVPCGMCTVLLSLPHPLVPFNHFHKHDCFPSRG